jgi:hypothetical protein
MFLRCHRRVKDGKEHRYYSVEESRRLQSGKVAQRRVLYLGEINDSQQAAWRRTLEVFDEQRQSYTTLSLFPEDCPLPADALDSVQVRLSEMQLRRARPYGNCWLGCVLWRHDQSQAFLPSADNYFSLLRRKHRRARGGGNVGNAVAFSKDCGKRCLLSTVRHFHHPLALFTILLWPSWLVRLDSSGC